MAEVARVLGYELQPWQRYVLDVALEVDPLTGLLVYRNVVLTVPRQQGKSTLLLCLSVWRSLGMNGPQNTVYAAQTGVDSRRQFVEVWRPVIVQSPLNELATWRLSNGHESIKWRSGSRIGIAATTDTAIHGQVVDLGIQDEAFSLVDDRMEQAFGPAQITRPQPQYWVVSTAGTEDSYYLNAKVEHGRELAERGVTKRSAFFEWSADPDADPGAVSTWKGCMPALGHTVSIEAVAAQFAQMDRPSFRRAFLNLADHRRHDSVIDAGAWNACHDPESKIVGPLCLAFDVTPDRSSAAIAAAGLNADGLTHVEVVEHRAGTPWVVAALEGLVERHRPSLVVMDAGGPAGGLLAAVEAAGIDVKCVSTREYQQACGAFFDDVSNGALRHIGQPELTAAVDGADRRIVSDSWLWSRKSSATDISPLVAATLARWAHKTSSEFDPADGVW